MVATAGPWRSRIVGSGRVDPKTLVHNPANWRTHPDGQRATLLALLREVGIVQHVIVNQTTGHLVDGHLRAGLAVSEDQPEIDVEYVELTLDEEIKVLALLDPITGLAQVNKAKLAELVARVKFENERLQSALEEEARRHRVAILTSTASTNDPGAQLDRAAELQATWGTKPGQLWEIPSRTFPEGAHRLICGDATDPVTRRRLQGSLVPALLHTDPPYGVNVVSRSGRNGDSRRSTANHDRPMAKTGMTSGKTKTLNSNVYVPMRGDQAPFEPDYLLKLAPVVILWGANHYADKLPVSPAWLVWDKREGITRNTFADGELAWCSKKGPVRVFHHLWNGIHRGSQNGEKRTHPAEKPVALFEEIGKMFAPLGVWLDLYAGTGAQLIAAERAGTICLAAEIEPQYCAVILERLLGIGLTPRLLAEENDAPTT